MSYDPANIFARILRNELPAHIVEETEHTLTFMEHHAKSQWARTGDS